MTRASAVRGRLAGLGRPYKVTSKGLSSIAVLFFCLTLMVPLLSSTGPLVYVDQPMWTAYTHTLVSEVVGDQHWFWGVVTDRENAGNLMGREYSLNSIFTWALSHFVGEAAAVKLFLVVSVLTAALCYHHFFMEFMPALASLLATLLLTSHIFQNAAAGMAYTHLSVGLALLFWMSAKRFWQGAGTKYLLGCTLLMTLTVYAHPLGSIACAVFFLALLFDGVVAARQSRDFRMTILFLAVPMISILLAAPQLAAMLFSSESVPLRMGKELDPFRVVLARVCCLELSDFKTQAFLILWSTVGAYRLWKMDNLHRIPVVCLFGVSLLLVSKVLSLSPVEIEMFAQLSIFASRFRYLLQLVYVLLAGIGISWVVREMCSTGHTRIARLAVISVTLLATAVIVGTNLRGIYGRSPMYLVTLDHVSYRQEVRELWKWIRENVRAGETRVYFEDSYRTYPQSGQWANHVLALTTVHTDVRQIGGWGGRNEAFPARHNNGFGGRLFGGVLSDSLSDDLIAARLRLLNCRYIVANSPGIKEALDRSGILRKARTIGSFEVYEFAALRPAWAYNELSLDAAELVRRSPSEYVLKADGEAGDPILVSLAYNGRWKATWKGNELKIDDHESIMRLRLPTAGIQLINLNFHVRKRVPIVMFLAGVVSAFILATARPNGTGRPLRSR